MFTYLGHAVRRGWLILLGAWAILLLATWYAAPRWDEVAHDREFAFLPAGSPSRLADEELARAFPNDRVASNVVLVLHQAGGQPLDRKAALDFINISLEPGLRQIAESEGGLAYEIKPSEEPLFGPEPAKPQAPPQRSSIAAILTPLTPGVGTLLISSDGKDMLVIVELTTDFLAVSNWAELDKIEKLLQDLKTQGKVPPGLEIALTGSAAIGRDHSQAELHSVRATGIITITLVIVLLILIYRAPLLALIPLATVYVSVETAIHLLAILGGHGYITPFQGLQIYITILAYGAGVDYCLFLTARYKEELDGGASPADAAGNAVRDVGAALLASAATVIGGIAMMIFAHFGKFREAGIAIPIALALVLLASLTFSPALLRLAGRWAFWPHPIGQGRAIGGGRLQWIWDNVGRILLRRPGAVWLVTVGVMAPFVVVAALCYNRISYDFVGDLSADAPSVAGTRLLRGHFPPGLMGPITILVVDPEVDFASPQGRDQVARLTDRLRDDREALELADVRSLTAPLGITEAARHPDLLGLHLSEEERRREFERVAREHYLTDLGGRKNIGTRLELVPAHNPFSASSIRDLDRIEQVVRPALPAGARVYVTGTTASVRDLAAAVAQDRRRIELLVVACVLVVLILLLRRLVVSIYLLLSVLLSYFASLGFAFVVLWLIDPHGFTGIDWKVFVFLFTILIAVGEDYNIFLMSRISEECPRHGKVRGVVVGVDRTGPIISSCGIIMAGTFGSLLGGSLTDMRQLGFALAFGVLLDTFVVRPVLVPSFLILMETGRIPFLRGAKGPGACADAPVSRESAPVHESVMHRT